MKAKVEIETDGVADEYEMNTTETWYKQQSWTQKPNQTTVSYHDDIVINYSNIGDHGYNDIDTNDIEYNDFISPDIETNDHHKPQEIQNNSILIILCSVIGLVVFASLVGFSFSKRSCTFERTNPTISGTNSLIYEETQINALSINDTTAAVVNPTDVKPEV